MNNECVMIVDDDNVIRKLAHDMLKRKGYKKLLVAASGAEALRLLQSERPALILLDIKMPQLSGLEVCRALKGNRKLKDIPVVMMTALRSGKDFAEAYNAGACDYIVKPFTLQDLLRKVAKHLKAARSVSAPQAESAPLA